MKELRRFITVSHEGQSRPYVYAYDYDELLAERDELLVALEGLEAAHCDTSPYLTKAQLSFGRKSLMAARAAIAKARGDV